MSDVTAAQLKNEGNELFREQDYGGALVKYSEALALDDKNAVLYANRAACNHGLNNYLDAMDDAKMATELDPGYTKGWSRLATVQDALGEWQQSAVTWQRALDALPTTNLSQTERRQKDQYTAGLKAAQARIEELGKVSIVPLCKMNEKDGKFPWQVAAEMLPELQRTASATNHEDLFSSAWVISVAYEDFTKGVNMMKDLKVVPRPQAPGGFVYQGRLDALTCITNGMIRDDRACHINEPDWVDMYNKQVMFEVTACCAWYSEAPEAVKEQAQTRLRENGWNDVRPALSVTVRGWIMRASWDGNIRHGPQAGVQYFKRALDLLEWGRAIWKDVSKNDRGVIFEDSFVTGVRALYLKMLLKAYSTDPGLNSKFPLEDLKEEAEDLLRETNRMLRNPTKDVVGPGFVSFLISYPAGIAHSTLGIYHVQMATYGSDPVERIHSFVKGAAAFTDAANKYPKDDESHAWYLNCTLDCLRNASVCIGDFNQVAIRLREAAPKMMKIWALSALAQAGRDTKIRANLDSAEDIMKLVAEGKLTLDDPVPSSLFVHSFSHS